MTELELALEVAQQINDAGIPCVIAGGAARDILHGRAPKDYDIVMMCDLNVDEAFEVLESEVGYSHMVPFGNGASMMHCQDAKLDWVIKFNVRLDDGSKFGKEVTFDLIQHKRHPTTPEEVVQCFDCNINQAWLTDEGCASGVEDYPLWNGGIIKALPLCDYPQSRMAYLREKYPQYTWPSDAELQAHPNYHKG